MHRENRQSWILAASQSPCIQYMPRARHTIDVIAGDEPRP